VRHFRTEHWNPTLWSRRMLRPWMEDGCRLDVDQAREVALQVLSEVRQRGLDPGEMSASLERGVLDVIERARQALTGC